jgi:hypothetical protein
VIRVSQGDAVIETLTGSAALAHLRNLQRKRSKAFEKAAQVMRARGFEPTDIVFVQRRIPRSVARGSASSVMPASESSISSSEGELVLWSWDDGNPSTWEGTIFTAAYGDRYAEYLSDAQLDISSASVFDTEWEELIEWYARERTPRYQQTERSNGSERGGVMRASLSESRGRRPYQLLQSAPKQPVNPVKTWAKCSLVGCAGAAGACWISGPGFGHCFTAWCTGAALGCAVGGLIDAVWGS